MKCACFKSGVVLIAGLTLGIPALAGPLMPSLASLTSGPIGTTVAGESLICSSVVTPGCGTTTFSYVDVSGKKQTATGKVFLKVDWIVQKSAAAEWDYYYQLENYTSSTAARNVHKFSLGAADFFQVGYLRINGEKRTTLSPSNNSGPVPAANSTTGIMDNNFTGFNGMTVKGHKSSNYANLGAPGAAETEPVDASPGGTYTNYRRPSFEDFINFGGSSSDYVAWNFGFICGTPFIPGGGCADNTIHPGEQSAILWGRSHKAPILHAAEVAGTGIAPAPWSTEAPGSDRIPAPPEAVPEPATVLLLGGVLAGLGVLQHRRQRVGAGC